MRKNIWLVALSLCMGICASCSDDEELSDAYKGMFGLDYQVSSTCQNLNYKLEILCNGVVLDTLTNTCSQPRTTRFRITPEMFQGNQAVLNITARPIGAPMHTSTSQTILYCNFNVTPLAFFNDGECVSMTEYRKTAQAYQSQFKPGVSQNPKETAALQQYLTRSYVLAVDKEGKVSFLEQE